MFKDTQAREILFGKDAIFDADVSKPWEILRNGRVFIKGNAGEGIVFTLVKMIEKLQKDLNSLAEKEGYEYKEESKEAGWVKITPIHGTGGCTGYEVLPEPKPSHRGIVTDKKPKKTKSK